MHDQSGAAIASRTPVFVWRSTKESVRTGTPSVLAAAEVIFAVVGYWAIAIYFDTFNHLWISICIAPLLLLKSDESIACGIAWFEKYKAEIGIDSYTRLEFYFGTIPIFISSVALAFVASRYLLITASAWSLLWRSMVIGYFIAQPGLFRRSEQNYISILVALVIGITIGSGANIVAICGAIAGTFVLWFLMVKIVRLNLFSGFEFVMVAPGISYGFWLRTIAIRFAATFLFFRSGLRQLPRNFRQTLFVIDFVHGSEFIPGYDKDPDFTSTGQFQRVLDSQKLSSRLVNLTIFLFFFTPAYVYRLSIKSTCWVYLPILYIAGERYSTYSPNHLVDRLQYSPWEKGRRLLGGATLFGFAATTLLSNFSLIWPTAADLKVISPIEFMFLLDIQLWKKPWQVCGLASALITIYLIVTAKDVRVDLRHEDDAQAMHSANKKVRHMKLAMLVRDVSSFFLAALLFIHSTLLLSPISSYLPLHVLRGFAWIYGDYMPPMPY